MIGNEADKHIKYKDDLGWLTWDFGLQQWVPNRELVFIGRMAQGFRDSGAAHLAKVLEDFSSLQKVFKFMMQRLEFTDVKWDNNPYLLGVANGAVNLRTLEFTKQRPEDYISYSIPVMYTPGASCPRFNKFITEVQPLEAKRDYCHKLLGSGLIAAAPDQLFHIWVGEGGNGKSALRYAVELVIGNLSGAVPTSIFVKNSDESSNRFSLSRVQSCRMIWASEVPSGKQLEEYRVKQLTGEDLVVVEEKGKKQQQVTFFATTIMMTNHIPTISDESYALRRRLRIISFDQKFLPEDEPDLKYKLGLERPGILNWLIRGAYKYITEGIGYPTEIKSSTQKAVRESFSLHDFLSETIEVSIDDRVSAKDISGAYIEWAKARGMSANISNRQLGDAISAFMVNVDKVESKFGISYRGWRLKLPEVKVI